MNKKHVEILQQGVVAWNSWREEHPSEEPNLAGAHLRGANLAKANLAGARLAQANLNEADLTEANLHKADLNTAQLTSAKLMRANLNEANLRKAALYLADLTKANLVEATLAEACFRAANLAGANLTKANLRKADLMHADLSEAQLPKANITGANLSWANLTNAQFLEAQLIETNFTSANLTKANLIRANLSGSLLWKADFTGAKLIDANLTQASLVSTNLKDTDLSGCHIFGISAWELQLERTLQADLVITPEYVPAITVDNLEVAQFVYLLLNNENIRHIIDTVGKKGVLILGRFTPERKAVLDAIRSKLRSLDYVPMMFDFDKPTEKDFTETIMTLAGMSRFIIADITNPKSSPLELQATVPNYMVPFVPVIQKGEKPFSMFKDLYGKFDWVLRPLEYDTGENLVKKLEDGVIKRALEKHKELILRKSRELETVKLEDL